MNRLAAGLVAALLLGIAPAWAAPPTGGQSCYPYNLAPQFGQQGFICESMVSFLDTNNVTLFPGGQPTPVSPLTPMPVTIAGGASSGGSTTANQGTAGSTAWPVTDSNSATTATAAGSPSDAPAVTGNGSVVALLKQLRALLASVPVTGTFWQAVQPVNGTVSTTGNPTTPTDRSGATTLGGTAQSLMPANATRHGCALQNLSTGDLWVNFTGAAAASPGSWWVPAGSYWACPETGVAITAGSVFGATTGQQFTAKEW